MEVKIVHCALKIEAEQQNPWEHLHSMLPAVTVAHLFLELLEGACNLNIGLNCGGPVSSPESE